MKKNLLFFMIFFGVFLLVFGCGKDYSPTTTTTVTTSSTTTTTIAPFVFNGLSSVVATGTTETILSWEAASSGTTPTAEFTYTVYSSTIEANVFLNAIASTAAGATTYAVSGLENGVAYYFGVRARNNSGSLETNTSVEAAVTQAFSSDFLVNFLEVGRYIEYNAVTQGGSSPNQFLSVEVINNVSSDNILVSTRYLGLYPFTWEINSGSLFQQNEGINIEVARFPLFVGKKWDGYLGSYHISSEVTKVTSVSVPMGNFDTVFEVDTYATVPSGTYLWTRMDFVKGYGPIYIYQVNPEGGGYYLSAFSRKL